MPSRCFIAFDLPADALRRLADARRAFLEFAPDWAGEKWVPPELQHVTLKFIGALDDAVLPDATAALGEACAGLPRARLELTGMRAKPAARRASMLWGTMSDADGSMTLLANVVDDVLAERFGVPASQRAFAPHVTLARARRPRRVPLEALDAGSARLVSVSSADGPMSVLSITLYSSTLGRDRPSYQALVEIPVGAAGEDA